VRRSAVRDIMAAGYLDVIKGNESEIKTVWGEGAVEEQRGVDSSSTLTAEEKARLVQKLAAREKNVVIMTGKTDFASDGERTFAVGHGHEYLGRVTGTGCVLGTTISAMIAVHPQDKLAASIAGLMMLEIAAEQAAAREGDVRGPGTFMPNFIDALYRIRQQNAQGVKAWMQNPKVHKAI